MTLIKGEADQVQNYVLVLTIPKKGQDPRFLALWYTEDGKDRGEILFARPGTHAYELRTKPDWKGKVFKVTVTLDNVSGELKEPDLLDEADIFLAPEEWVASTCNVLFGHNLFGYRFSSILLVIFFLTLLSTLLFKPFLRKPLIMILTVTFCTLWVIFDLCTIYDHVQVVSTVTQEKPQFRNFGAVGPFVDQLKKVIDNRTWTMDDSVGWPFNCVIKYALAEKKFITKGSADYLITKDVNQAQPILEFEKIRLIKK